MLGVAYILLHRQHADVLHQINEANAIINGWLLLSSWGLRDYLLKQAAQYPEKTDALLSKIILAKVPLLIVTCFALLFLGLSPALYIAICLLIALKSFSLAFDAGISLSRENHIFMFLETVSLLIILFALIFLNASGLYVFLYGLVITEGIRFLYSVRYFSAHRFYKVRFKESMILLYETRYFFILALFSFIQIRADVYLLGFYFHPETFNLYQVKSSLITFAHVALSSYLSQHAGQFYQSSDPFSNITLRNRLLKNVLAVAAISLPVMLAIEYFLFGTISHPFHFLLQLLNIFLFAFALYEFYFLTRNNTLQKAILPVLGGALLNICLSCLLLPTLNISGGLISYNLSTLLIFLWLRTIRILSQRLGPSNNEKTPQSSV